MPNYFQSINSKSCIKSKEIFSNDGANSELLLKYYAKNQSKLNQKLGALDSMFKRWSYLLFSKSYNVAVTGRQSKFRLLELFKARFLDKGKTPDLECTSPDNGTSVINITTVRIHGLTQISLETFIHALFNVMDSQKASDEDIGKFLSDLKRTKTHYVFLLHSFELLYKDCRKTCDLIFRLYEQQPEFIHILLSVDHINSCKLLESYKHQLQLIFYQVPCIDSFLYEKTCSFGGSAVGGKGVDPFDITTHKLVEGVGLDLKWLKDIYQALQKDCRMILIFILKSTLELHHLIGSENAEIRRQKLTNGKSLRRSGRITTNQDKFLHFDMVMKYCEANFLARRENLLRNHLNELADHQIIELDSETGNKIKCLLSLDLKEKFIKYVEQDQES